MTSQLLCAPAGPQTLIGASSNSTFLATSDREEDSAALVYVCSKRRSAGSKENEGEATHWGKDAEARGVDLIV